MPKVIILVGPPGSGKSTLAKKYADQGYAYINQDSQGKEDHFHIFNDALSSNRNIVVDRMNFNHQQRNRYLLPKQEGYIYEIHILHESYKTCMNRCLNRINHETIKNEMDAKKALNFFFKNYERPEDYEADLVVSHYPNNNKPSAIICDLDGTLCNIDPRLHHVRQDERRKNNWTMFFAGIKDDKINGWCAKLLQKHWPENKIILCSGRGEEYRVSTVTWLEARGISTTFEFASDNKLFIYELYMRMAGDMRKDSIVKEILLDFEILTRYTPMLVIDDRKQVVDMWRRRGLVCLQCAEGDF